MRRQHSTVGLSLAALLLVSCAKSGVDNKVAAIDDVLQIAGADDARRCGRAAQHR